MSLVLGTAQLGILYGAVNVTGKPDRNMATEIVRAAWEGGICEFDTAQDYGESEQILGNAFRQLGVADQVKVASKLAKNIDVGDRFAVEQAVLSSIERLGVKKLSGLFLRSKAEFLESAKAWVVQGLTLVDRIGVSIYLPEQVLSAIETAGIRILQIPSNILDRRFERARAFERAEQCGMEVYVRSVFLQGLLLMNPHKLPPHLQFAQSIVERADALARELGVSRQVLALQYVKTAFPNARIIVGAETAEQVQENLAAWKAPVPAGIMERVREVFPNIDDNILDPRKWPKA